MNQLPPAALHGEASGHFKADSSSNVVTGDELLLVFYVWWGQCTKMDG